MSTTRRPTDGNDNNGPKTIKEALSGNVKHQQERADRNASPPEAQRSPRERIKDREDEGSSD